MKVAFFTLNAYDMLTGGHEGEAVGGAQLQQILVGTELAARGHDVYFVEYDADYKSERAVDGIQVVTKPKPTGSELRRMVTVFDGTRRVLRRLEPDVCYRRSLDFEILPLTGYAKLTDARFVYGVAHDDELTAAPRKFDNGIKTTRLYRWLNRQALAAADAVITQNPTQTELAEQLGRTEVAEIPNCYPADSADPVEWSYKPPVVFWAARFAEWKQPEIVLELAQSLPEVTFVMAGDGDNQLFERFSQQAADIDNLVVLGHVPFAEIDRYFAAADLFLNTSEEEGFPNTFLQAWANETPVVSLQVDPGDVLTEEGIGIVTDGSASALHEQIKTLAENPKKIAKLGQLSHEYLKSAHSVERITDKYEQVFEIE